MCQATAEQTACHGAEATADRIFNLECCGTHGCINNNGIPTKCSAQCADAFLPFWSRCGQAAYSGNQAKLGQMSAFADTCATSQSIGRQPVPFPHGIGTGLPTTAGNAGPNPADPCYSPAKTCEQCGGEQCGWCQDEVAGSPSTGPARSSGFCSSRCVTPPDECGRDIVKPPPYVEPPPTVPTAYG